MPTISRSKIRRDAKKAGYRSGFEHQVAKDLTAKGVVFDYEKGYYEYEVRETRKYTPDFFFDSFVVECKGRLTAADRKKLLLVKKAHPDLDIRLLFQYDNKITRTSKMRYSDWATKHGFSYAIGSIPKRWLT